MHFRDFLNGLRIPRNNWLRRFTVTYIHIPGELRKNVAGISLMGLWDIMSTDKVSTKIKIEF